MGFFINIFVCSAPRRKPAASPFLALWCRGGQQSGSLVVHRFLEYNKSRIRQQGDAARCFFFLFLVGGIAEDEIVELMEDPLLLLEGGRVDIFFGG